MSVGKAFECALWAHQGRVECAGRAYISHGVRGTVHRQFYPHRRAGAEGQEHLHSTMWRGPASHRPTQEEALASLDHLRNNGDSDPAFGWTDLKDARMGCSPGCSPVAAE